MAISFYNIENAFSFVSMDQKYMHSAYLCKETGQIFYTDKWHKFEDERQKAALKKWCMENNVEIKG